MSCVHSGKFTPQIDFLTFNGTSSYVALLLPLGFLQWNEIWI